jgi:hypothetical protein
MLHSAAIRYISRQTSMRILRTSSLSNWTRYMIRNVRCNLHYILSCYLSS